MHLTCQVRAELRDPWRNDGRNHHPRRRISLKSDVAHGRGAPGEARLFIDGEFVGGGELPVTIPLDIGITEGLRASSSW
jgi:hypothetical protein